MSETPKPITEKLWANKDIILGVLIGLAAGYVWFKWIKRKPLAPVAFPQQQPVIPVPARVVNVTTGATASAPGVASFENLGDLVGMDGIGDQEHAEYMG